MAGIKLFAQNGFHKTTLKELADEAGLSYGNIYDYVGSKEDIFFLIHDFLAGSAMEILNRSIEEIHDPIEKLRRMIRGEFNLMDQWADALLLIYQESHIFQGEFLRKLLQKERAHLEKFEIVLNECISTGQLRPCNVRLVSNLIKSMIDSWTIKRWDLRGHANQLEVERSIMEIITNGLVTTETAVATNITERNSLFGKTALVANGGTLLGQAVCHALSAKGVRIVAHLDRRIGFWKPPNNAARESFCIPLHLLEQDEALTPAQIQEVEKQYGPIDFYIHDIGIGTMDQAVTTENEGLIGPQHRQHMESNLHLAQSLGRYFQNRMGARCMGRIVYLAPWAWDAYADPTRFAVVKAGAIALTRSLSKQLASANVNVNCIVPGHIRGLRPLKIEKALGRGLLAKIPSGRLGEIFDVTESVLFLIQDATKYLTGQVLHVTGGDQ
ncbi:MAG: SDR family oxidoreductase [Desulfatitalea sp.]|nr:SDR family oxidoreductase [Desulfatitalea sp.]